MTAIPERMMSLNQFLDWSREQPERYELVDGQVVAMGRDRVSHNRAKRRAAAALQRAVEMAGVDCEAFVDGIGIGLPEGTFRLPDAALQCGPLEDDALFLSRPVVAVEVVSPTSEERDVHAKLADYFSVPTLEHYMIVYDDRRLLVHHRRDGDDVHTAFVRDGSLQLTPPGIEVAVAAFFGEQN